MQTQAQITHRAGRVRRRAIPAITVLATAVSLGACGSSSTSSTATPTALLNTQRVALAIQQSILKSRHVHATVNCPQSIVQQKGRNFTCDAVSRNAKHALVHTTFTVVQQNDSGGVYYSSPQ